MEFTSSSEDLKEESPSQEGIGYIHPMKLELESMDDFEHITKEVSPSKEATAQFLQHETTYASNHNISSKDPFEIGNVAKGEVIEDESHGLPPTDATLWAAESASLMDNTNTSADVLVPAASTGLMDQTFEDDDVGSSKNFMQYEKIHESKGHDLPTKEVTSDEDKLIDFESPAVYDESPVKSGDFILTNNSEILMPDNSDSKNTPPTITSQSLPGIIKNENEGDVHSEKLPQGDGIHLRQTSGLDTSDTEEHIPEPVPKDYPEIGVIEPKDFLSAIGIDNWFRPERLNPKVESLIYWRDVKKSGVAFGSGLIVLLSLCYCSLISVVAYTSLTVLTASAGLKIYQNVVQAIQKSDTTPFKEKLEKILMNPVVVEVFQVLKDFFDFNLEINEEKLSEFLNAFVKNLNNFIIEIRRRFLLEDIVDSVKFAVILWAMTYIGSWFNGLTLLIIGYVALFTLPKVYENNKTQIDANLDIVKEKIATISDKIRAVIPVGKKEEDKSKNE